MLKTSKLISLLLVAAMLMSLFSVAIVSTSAAAVEEATIIYDGTQVKAHVGDKITYKAYMDVRTIPTASDGYVTGVNGVTYYDQSNLTIDGTLKRKNFPTFLNPGYGADRENAIYYNDVDPEEGFECVGATPLINVTFEITKAGTATITNKINQLIKKVDAQNIDYILNGELQPGVPSPVYTSTLDVNCPHPDEPDPTQAAPTQPAGDKAVVTVYGLDGESETQEFNVGDTFTVYTTLNASAFTDGKGKAGGIGSINGSQTYTNAVLALADEYDPDEGDIIDLEEMFPITKDRTVANGMYTSLVDVPDLGYEDPTLGAIFYNASTPSQLRPFRFDDNDDILIKSNYTVTNPGVAEIRNTFETLAIADEELTRIVDKGKVVQEGMRFHASFTWPEPEPTEPAPTEAAPTEPAPTEAAPTEAAPTEAAPTEAAPTEAAPTEAAPTEAAPTEAAPTEAAPTEAAPTEAAPTEAAPTEAAPTEAAPTEAAPTEPIGNKAIVTIYGLDGESETKEFEVGETFTVYTTLNTANIGQVGSLNGTQTYTNAVLALADEYDPDEGDIIDLEAMFPITKGATVANGKWTETEEDPALGAIYFNASTPSTSNAFKFDDNNDILIKSNYTVAAPGEAEIRTTMKTLAKADDDLTRIIDKGQIVNPDFRLHASYTWPEEVEPTEAEPTEPAPQTAKITIYGFDGQSVVKEYSVGETFYVYTTLSAKDKNGNSYIASVNGEQTFSSDILSLATSVDEEGLFTDNAAVFPILGDAAMGRLSEAGKIQYNASTPNTETGGFKFDSDNDQLIVTSYTVIAGGEGEIKNALITLVSADEDLTKIVDKGKVTDGSEVGGYSSLEKPEPDPTEPAPTEPAPTEPAPTEPAPTEPAPTEAEPTEPAPQTAIVNIYDIGGELNETKQFNIGDEFTVYTILNASAINDGKIAAISGYQTYTDSVVALQDEVDEEGSIVNLNDVFPVTGEKSLGNAGAENGVIYFNASTPSIDKAFVFDSESDVVIATTYKVAEAGVADIQTFLKMVAAADDDLTRIIENGDMMGDIIEYMTFNKPEPKPTEAEPTEAEPTEAAPTEAAPTEAAPTEAAPTEPAPQTAIVNIYGIDGDLDETKEFNIGDKFTVYTVLNASAINDGKIAAISGYQTYTDSVVALQDEVDEEGSIVNLNDVFPVTGEKSLGNAGAENGCIYFNASTPSIDKAFVFDSESDVIIATTYEVTAGGTADIFTHLKMVAAADDDLTRIVEYDDPAGDIIEYMTFNKPEPKPTEAEPTEAEPTEAPAPTEAAPTEAQPTEAQPTEAQPTEAQPTEAQPTEAQPTEAQPTEAPVSYYIVGSMTNWKIDPAYKLTPNTNADTEEYMISGMHLSTTDQFKVASSTDGQSIKDWYPGGGMEKNYGANNEITDNGTYNVYFRPNYDGGDDWFEHVIYAQLTAADPTEAQPTEAQPTEAQPTEAQPTEAQPTEAQPTEAQPTEAQPTEAQPTEAQPTEAQPTEAQPTEAQPTEAQPTEAQPTEAQPTEAQPTEAQPTEAQPTEAQPTEAQPTEAQPTEAAKAIITIYGLDGQSEVKEFDLSNGPVSFDVYTYLDASKAAEGGKISGVNAAQTYSDNMLTLDSASFPILNKDGENVVTNSETPGKIAYIASTPDIDKPFVFNSNDDVLIKTTYTVTAPGEGEVRNELRSMGAADEDLTPIVKKGDVVDPEKPITVESSFDEREIVPDPTEAPEPTEAQPTEAQPTEAQPTEAQPTEAQPTEAQPTEAQPTEAQPTEAQPTEAQPTEAQPTEAQPTEAQPTEAQPTEVQPTEVQPTEAQPTEAQPTEAQPTEPVEPTTSPTPGTDKVYINADGNLYEVTPGTDHTYTFYLTDAGTICGIDATTTWDHPEISIVGDPNFPILGGDAPEFDTDKTDESGDPAYETGVVTKNYDIVDKDGKLIEKQIAFNWTSPDGVDFNGEKAPVITFTIHVAEDAAPGTYYITTNIKTLEGQDEEKQVFEDTDIKQPPVKRNGEIDGEPGTPVETAYAADEQTYQLKSLEDKTFTVNATGDADDSKTFGKFRSLWIDLNGDGNYTLVDYSNYTKASGSLKLTLKSDYMETLKVGDYKLKFVFSDGEAVGTLHVVEAEEPTKPASKPTEKVTPKPAATTAGSSTQDTKSTTNSAAVQTGSPEIAIFFVIILVMAAGIILFTKKRKNED